MKKDKNKVIVKLPPLFHRCQCISHCTGVESVLGDYLGRVETSGCSGLLVNNSLLFALVTMLPEKEG